MKKLTIITLILMIFSISCKKSKQKPMEESENTNVPVISKKFENKYESNNNHKDTIEFKFVKSLNKDSNEYVLKNIFKAMKHYLKNPTTITDKDYDIVSNEVIGTANTLDSKLKFSVLSDGTIALQSPEMVIGVIYFKKL